LRVPEVWRFDGRAMTFNELQANGKYWPIPHSNAFPIVTSTDLQGFLALIDQLDETSAIRQFRAWIRQRISGSGLGQP
jgi:hypothetical protein